MILNMAKVVRLIYSFVAKNTTVVAKFLRFNIATNGAFYDKLL
jgi:hypothetical protein